MRETVDNDRHVEAVSLEALRTQTNDPFLRWSVPDSGFLGAWRVGDSFAVARTRGLRMAMPAPWVLMLGEPTEVAALVEEVPRSLGASPGGVTVSAAAYPVLPADRWGFRFAAVGTT